MYEDVLTYIEFLKRFLHVYSHLHVYWILQIFPSCMFIPTYMLIRFCIFFLPTCLFPPTCLFGTLEYIVPVPMYFLMQSHSENGTISGSGSSLRLGSQNIKYGQNNGCAKSTFSLPKAKILSAQMRTLCTQLYRPWLCNAVSFTIVILIIIKLMALSSAVSFLIVVSFIVNFTALGSAVSFSTVK